MVSPRNPITWLLTAMLVVCFATVSGRAQESRGENAAGAGWLAPGVFVTWEAHREAAGDAQSPLTLDLLVFWRGNPGWFDYEQVSAGAGAPNGRHGVTSRGKSVELTFDRDADSVVIGGQTVSMQGANVLLLDAIDDANGALVAGTRQVDSLPTRDEQGSAVLDPVKALVKQTPELFEYLRCDPVFANANDPGSAITLGTCSALR